MKWENGNDPRATRPCAAPETEGEAMIDDLTKALQKAICPLVINPDKGFCECAEFETRCCPSVREILAAHDAALEAAGYQIVPKEPTKIMLMCTEDAVQYDHTDPKNAELDDRVVAYKAMLAAAPKLLP